MIRIFVGYDKRETAAAYVLAHSIQAQASMPVQFTFLNLSQLRGILTRPRGQYDSTDFAISRFLVPYLCNYEGWAIFMDCDIVCRDDIAKLWAWRDERYAVRCVKHHHQPDETTKFLGQPQTRYACKNWSSVMLFNCAHESCRLLTREYVNSAPGLELHQFAWQQCKVPVGDLPAHWNLLVDYDAHDPRAALVHYTKGGPYFPEYAACDYHADWWAQREDMLRIDTAAKKETRRTELQTVASDR